MNARQKGKSGEYEVMHMLQEVCDDVFAEFRVKAPRLRRNAMAYADGGEDIVGLPWYSVEVKRVEKLEVGKWWVQCLAQAKEKAPGVEECGRWELMPDYFASRGRRDVPAPQFSLEVQGRALSMASNVTVHCQLTGLSNGIEGALGVGLKPHEVGGGRGATGIRGIPSRAPVLFYRQSKSSRATWSSWRVVMYGTLPAWADVGQPVTRLRVVTEMSVEPWLQWFRCDLRSRLLALFPDPPATPG